MQDTVTDLFETAVIESTRMLADERLPSGTAPKQPAAASGSKRSSKSSDENLTTHLRSIAAKAGFEVESMLGRGGMGAVLLARDRELGRQVALKFLATPDERDTRVAKMFRQEAERASRLTHENVVQVYSWHSVGKLTFFVMEYVDGDNLQQLVQREFRITVEEILRIIAEAASGVATAHESGIVHRDIKPQNIMISRSGRVKVADFGLASSTAEQSRGDVREIAGTLGFMAPEQARGEPVTFASDVYSLAATMYYGLTRVSPYGTINSFEAMLLRNQAGDVVPLETVRPGLHPAIYKLMEYAMAADPLQRYPDARSFRQALEAVILNIHKEVPKKTLVDRLPEWFSLPSLIAGAVIGGLVGAAITFSLFWW